MIEKRYNVLIIDDLKIHRDYLTNLLLNQFTCFNELFEANNVESALEIIYLHRIDIVFLDVEMPRKNGFQFIKEVNNVRSQNFDVIFVTAYDRYAIQAIKNAALDYVLKPVDLVELKHTIDRFINKRTNQNSDAYDFRNQNKTSSDSLKSSRIALPTLNGYLFVEEKDILCCTADNTYTVFYLSKGKNIVVSKTLKECEETLSSSMFFRVHHSHLVNLSFIKEYVKGEGGHLVLLNDQLIPVSRSKKQSFLALIKKV